VRFVWIFLLLGCCFIGTSCRAGNGKTVTISMDGQTFTPDPITVSQGTNVCWVNKDSADHWPASNIHPTHEIYPAFDPKKGVASGETWCFVFGKFGIWKYHDHLSPNLVGTVNVE
jgi:plastocyanin